jgi:hypothetical protein
MLSPSAPVASPILRRLYLAEGEHGVIMIVAADRKKARNILQFIRGFLEIPLLAKRVLRATAEGVDLKNRVSIEISTASHRAIRGYSVVACLAGELAFWPVDENSSSPDFAVLDAVRPAMATTNGMLLCASSPYGQKGALWSAYRRFYGKDDAAILVWKGCNAGNESDG